MIAKSFCDKKNWVKRTNQEKQENLKSETIYYLDQNKNELRRPKFLRDYVHIQYSNDFPNEEFNKYIMACYDNYDSNNQEQLEEKLKPIKDKYPDYHVDIEWLTISNTQIDIDHISTTSKIQLTGKSTMKAEYSVFIPKEISKTESAIEIFANSKATFKNCIFKDSKRTAVITRDFSFVVFDHCVFENNNISCFIMNGSSAKFINCKFKCDKNISIFVTKDGKCEIENCTFFRINGKAIFVKDSSELILKDTLFSSCNKGAATISEKSKLSIDSGVTIENSNNTALRAIKNSEIRAHDLLIVKTDGNAINMEDSTGFFINCDIKETFHPTIAVIGRKSNPIFNNCNLSNNMNTFCVICKNSSRPLFDNCNFFNCSTNCFSITDFSRPHIQNCNFSDIKKFYLNIIGDSHVTFDNIKSFDDSINLEEKINVSKSSKCENKKLNEIDIQNGKIEEENDNEDDVEHEQCKSWISPKYEIPPELNHFNQPEIIKSLKFLKIIKLKELIKETEKMEIVFKCSHCHKEMNQDDEPNIICPCGHLICSKCKGIKKCPICDTPIKNVQKIFIENECAICLDHKPNTISLPCGHLCMCYECAVKNSLNNFNCPICNEPLSGYKFIFDDISINTFHMNLNHLNDQNKYKNDSIEKENYQELKIRNIIF